MSSLCWEIVAALSFLGTHFVLSHPLRAPIVRAVGEAAFLGLYSLVAFATLGWLAFAFRAVPAEAPYWAVGDGLWVAATIADLCRQRAVRRVAARQSGAARPDRPTPHRRPSRAGCSA